MRADEELSIALALLVFTWLLGGIAEAREGGHFGGEHGGADLWGGHGPEGWGHHWGETRGGGLFWMAVNHAERADGASPASALG